MTAWMQLLSGAIFALLISQRKGDNVRPSAKLYPGTHFENDKYSEAVNAIDGRTNIGKRGRTIAECASTKDSREWRRLQYLQIDLQRPYSIAAIRLHLLDGEPRRWQNGLVVSVSNSTIETSMGTQCGEAYDANKFGQSPLFACWKSGRYVYAILRDTFSPLQVCKMQIFKGMNLTAPGVATIFPDDVYEYKGRKALAKNAVDGMSSIGESDARGGQNCAGLNVLKIHPRNRKLQYLKVDLGHSQYIYCIRLHLRDGKDKERYSAQKGMVVSISNRSHISSLNHTCGLPYNPKTDGQSPVFVCESSGRYIWMTVKNHTKPLFICEVEVYVDDRCAIVASPPNGKYIATRLTHGGSLNVSCEKGFRPSSLESIICEMSGNWSGPLPICQETVCRNISTINNGDLQLSGVAVGSTATYTCNRGFKIQHQGNTIKKIALYCVQRARSKIAEWDKSIPNCILDDQYCLFENPPNGKAYHKTDNGLGIRIGVTFRCNPGYSIVGQKSLQCTGKVPSCIAVCPTPVILDNVQLKRGANKQHFFVNYSITYKCRFGYETPQNATTIESTCQTTRTWSMPAPSWLPVNCGDPIPPVNGIYNLINGTTTFGSQIVHLCNLKHYPVGSIYARCNGKKMWSNNPPICRPYCNHPGITTNGRLKGKSISKLVRFDVNTTVKYRCNVGYELSKLSFRTRTCQPDSLSWSGSLPLCIPVDCGQPVQPENGAIVLTNTTFGSVVKFSCSLGHYLQGNEFERCEASKQWSSNSTKCILFCERPVVVGGRLLGIDNNRQSIDVGTTVEYRCNTGYELSGRYTTRTCLANGQWSGTAPSCKNFNCSSCHKQADCVAATYCRCKQEYVGNGKFCCPEDMGGEVTLAEATALIRCDRSCSASFKFLRVMWFKNGSPLDLSQTRYGLARKGMLLYVEKLTPADSGEYTCKVHVGQTTYYQRYCSLEVIDSQIRNTPLCSLDCGQSCSPKPFVARGILTYAGQFPWQAMLCSSPHGQYCGGVLVSSDCILTAAQCLIRGRSYIQNISVCLGRQCGNCSERDAEGNPQCFRRHSFVVHPQFNSSTLDNDIAVIKLTQPPSLDCTSVYPVCLPNKTRDGFYIRAQKQGIVTGWGRVNSTVSRSTCLRKGHVQLASRRICDIRHNNPITNSMMCATDYNGACEGDSGGPLVVQNRQYGDRYVLAGIVSWGTGCGTAKKLGVYTSVLSHLDWIMSTCANKI